MSFWPADDGERMRPTDWLAQPRVSFSDAGNEHPYALIRLRDTAPAYTMQPNPDCMVFFHLGADHRPVSIEFLEPVPGRLAFKVLTRLMESPAGEPFGVRMEPAPKSVPMTPEEIVAVIRAMDEAQERLTETAGARAR
jgi:hypothetical protein